MGMYKYVKETWKKSKDNLGQLWIQKLSKWRAEPVTVRLEHPTRIDRARNLGYKAKQGVFVVRQRVKRGGRMRPDIKGGRRSKHARQRKIVKKSYQVVAEGRAARKYVNCEVLNSYWVGEDGKNVWYEVIMVDRSHPAILADKNYAWIANPANRGRIYRGLTSAARKSRGLRYKGIGVEKNRPSLNANRGHGN